MGSGKKRNNKSVKDSYCYMITLAASKLLAAIKDATLDEVVKSAGN
jgi:hypothetical protein